MIAIISDTHENETATVKALEIIRQKNPDFTIHLGDIISPPMLELFKGMKIKFLLGNNDGEIVGLKAKARELGLEEPQEELIFEQEGKTFYAYHGTNPRLVQNAIEFGNFDYVLYGHTHVKRDEKIKGRAKHVHVINPGALFRAKEYTIALLDIQKDEVEFVHINK